MTTNASLAITLHVLSAVIWVGGMFFAHQVLRPVAVAQLEPPARLRLWTAVFRRFFPWVWLAVLLLPASGYWMISGIYGGMASVGLHIHIMQGLGWLMILLYVYLYFGAFRQLKEAVVTEQWPQGGRQLTRIRHIVGVNLVLGLIVVATAAGGRYL
ncbi:MAG TPA: hypothetical protein ENK05_11335 [Gammaproteobacteria bacterium]|nr:hypothetical protein [Gammaproteobacteria bacterium]